MDQNIFTKEFWIEQWNTSRQSADNKNDDTYKVSRGYATAEYWDRASHSYDTNDEETASRKIEKTIRLLKENKLIFPGCNVLEIGSGTGLLARELARNDCNVTAIDFSKGMIDRSEKELPRFLENKVDFLHRDWNRIDIGQSKWEKRFDLSIAFMCPAVSTPESLFKMIKTAKKGCAIRGWAKKRKHYILDALWEKIMHRPLSDKPQSFFFKLNLLFSLGYFPEVTFDKIEWEDEVELKNEIESRFAFFKTVSEKGDKELKKIIETYLESISKNGVIKRKDEGLTATAIWHI